MYITAYNLGYNNIVSIDIIPKKYAVMFDIDDTLLEVPRHLYDTFTPIQPMINLLNECKKRKLTIVIITARDSVYHDETAKQLKKFNIYYDELYSRHSPVENYQEFKSDAKQNKFSNYKFVMSVGDQLGDVIGEYSGYCIKLPNENDSNLYQSESGKLVKVNPRKIRKKK